MKTWRNLLLAAATVMFTLTGTSCKKEELKVELQSLKINPATLVLVEGEEKELTVKILPEELNNIGIIWESSDESVAEVDANGKVTALSEGETIIMAIAPEYSKTAKCKVKVNKKIIAVETAVIEPKNLALYMGETFQLKILIGPDNATEKGVEWVSEHPEFATVDENGLVTAIAPGKTKIIGNVGDKRPSCLVTVMKEPVESVTLDKTEVELTEGETINLTATVKPDNASDKTVTWTSDHPEIAKVEDGKITAISAGTAIITAEAQGKEATCTVKVKAPYVKVTGLSFKMGEKMACWVRTKGELESALVIEPADATTQKAVWTSSDTEVLTIDQEGKFEALKVGESMVKATISEGNEEFVATLKVTVKTDMEIRCKDYGFAGEKIQLTSNYAEVTWKVERVDGQAEEKNNGTMSKIDHNGLLTLGPGSTFNSKYPDNMKPVFEDHTLKVTGTNKYGESVQKEIVDYTWKIELCYTDETSDFTVVDAKTHRFNTYDIVHVRIECNCPDMTAEDLSKWELEYGPALSPTQSTWNTVSNKIGPILEIQDGGNVNSDIDKDEYRMIAKLGNVSSKTKIYMLSL